MGQTCSKAPIDGWNALDATVVLTNYPPLWHFRRVSQCLVSLGANGSKSC